MDTGTKNFRSRFKSYWYYSTALAITWAMVLMLVLSIRGPSGTRIDAPTHQAFVGNSSTTPTRHRLQRQKGAGLLFTVLSFL